MTHSAFDTLVAAARHLEGRDGIVANGATTTVVPDAYWGLRTQNLDTFKGGTYFQKMNGASVWDAVRVIQSSIAGAYTLATALASAPTAGGAYTVLGNSTPFSQLAQKLMGVVDEFGDTMSKDASLLTVLNQYEYTIPASATTVCRVLAVEVEDAITPGLYHEALGAQIDDARGVIVFPYLHPAAGLHIRLTLSTSYHLEINLSSLPALPDTIHPAWASLEVAARVARWRLAQSGEDTGKEAERVQHLFDRAKAVREKYILPRPVKQPRFAFTEVR